MCVCVIARMGVKAVNGGVCVCVCDSSSYTGTTASSDHTSSM